MGEREGEGVCVCMSGGWGGGGDSQHRKTGHNPVVIADTFIVSAVLDYSCSGENVILIFLSCCFTFEMIRWGVLS